MVSYIYCELYFYTLKYMNFIFHILLSMNSMAVNFEVKLRHQD